MDKLANIFPLQTSRITVKSTKDSSGPTRANSYLMPWLTTYVVIVVIVWLYSAATIVMFGEAQQVTQAGAQYS